jgi:hypothetical protein
MAFKKMREAMCKITYTFKGQVQSPGLWTSKAICREGAAHKYHMGHPSTLGHVTAKARGVCVCVCVCMCMCVCVCVRVHVYGAGSHIIS